MTFQAHDMTKIVDPTHDKGAGPIRLERPIYRDLLPPCNHACPAGEDIQAWLAHAQAGRFEKAWRKLTEDNPLPAVHGRVCYHPCETSCNRNELDSAVSIHAVERMLGDLANEKGWTIAVAPPTGKRVLVVGSGPGGLSAAYHLRRLGHSVEMHEAGAQAGGMMRYGIPAYRLPREVLAQDIARIEAMGVKIVLNSPITDVNAARQAGHFDAVFIAIGLQLGKRIDIPCRDVSHVFTAVNVLHEAADAKPLKLGRRVAVYGAGDTAMDAARTARRQGAEETVIIYASDRAHMKAHALDAEEAVAEGVTIKLLSRIRDMDDDTLNIEVMTLDANGKPQPTGVVETLKADSLILALGQNSDSGFLKNLPGIAFTPAGAVVITSDMMTGAPGVFAGGDCAPGDRTVTTATGQGKKAARHMDAWLRGAVYEALSAPPLVTYAMLDLPIYADAPRAEQIEEAAKARVKDFSEITAGLSDAAAQQEAKRCLSCGNCFECDKCYAACPEDAIEKRGPGLGYAIKMDLCTGCAVCVEQCPCHAMEMIPEPARIAVQLINGNA